MKAVGLYSRVCAIVLCAAGCVAAADGLATPGKLVFEDDFARGEMAPKWRVGKGTFDVKDGVVTATELPGTACSCRE